MIGFDIDQQDYEVFMLLYTVAIMHQLSNDKLLLVKNIPPVTPAGKDKINEAKNYYPLPVYRTMAELGFHILKVYNANISFTVDDLEKLFVKIEANNGYYS